MAVVIQEHPPLEGKAPETVSQASASTETLNEIRVPLGLEALEPSFSLADHLRSVDLVISFIHDVADIYLSPFSWSAQKKTITLLGPFMASTLAAYAAGAYALASEPLRNKWDISDTLFNIGITLFVVGFAFAPMVLAPISETHGRYWTFVGSGVVFFLGTLGCALTENYVGMMVSRLITGNGAAVFATLTGGVVSDLYRKENRNTPMALYSMTIMVGASLGPLISGSVVDLLGWRWIFFIQLITIGITTVVLFFLFQETRSNVLLRRKCLMLSGTPIKSTTGAKITFAPATKECLDIEISMLWRGFAFPLRLLSKEPIVFSLGSCSMGIFSIYLAVFNYLADTYHGYASSALAAQSLCRNILGGVFPLVTARMISSLTLKGTGGLLGGLGLLLTGIPWLLYIYGQRIRARSPFAKGME
ncbi:hypothetical protein FOCG_14998 [Fusarium oxysporum f. sp. radicis-lycopersici 26381]|nr:hypothetical protein FOCG_14998 [Fusarium oxysporum f. sp. radicis-lycopersici 26381]